MNGVAEATINQIRGASGKQMMKCSDVSQAYIVSPSHSLGWSWSIKQKVGGTWNVNGGNQSCGTASEFDTVSCGWGVGCSNGGGGTNKLYPGTYAHNTCSTDTLAHTNAAFTICGNANYGSYSIFVRSDN